MFDKDKENTIPIETELPEKENYPADTELPKKTFKGLGEYVKENPDVSLTFKQNRAFELHVGRRMFRFDGQVTIYVPRWVLKHKDFTKDIKNLFVVKGA